MARNHRPARRRFAGSRLRHARLVLGLYQYEAAALVPTSQGRWSEYERNLREPSAATLPAVADAIGCSIDFLFAPADEPEAEAVTG